MLTVYLVTPNEIHVSKCLNLANNKSLLPQRIMFIHISIFNDWQNHMSTKMTRTMTRKEKKEINLGIVDIGTIFNVRK